MGWGDEIMASGQAREMFERTGKRVLIRDARAEIRWHAAWENNPHILTRNDRVPGDTPELHNGPGKRPYIAQKFDDHWVWKAFKAPVGELFFSPAELSFAEGFANALSGCVVIEPNLKAKAPTNKDWGRERWSCLVELLRAKGIGAVQLGESGTQLLPHVRYIQTPSFRLACAVLARARAAVLPEGGLHHAAAALGVRSVVIYGGYISPEQTGYDLHINLFTGGKPCGRRQGCSHCQRAMAEISPELVLEKLETLL